MFSVFLKYNTFKYGILNKYTINFILQYQFDYAIINYRLIINRFLN